MINKKRANEVTDFIQLLNLTDDFHGQNFILQNWQREVLDNVYGTMDENDYRQYNYAYLEIPKKNGKTTLIAALAVYHLVCDRTEGQIYCCAADRGQAQLVYKAAVSMIQQNKFLENLLKITDSKKQILNKKTSTVMKVLSAEAYTKHGINPTIVIFDELHAQKNRDLWDVMTFGAGASRKEPLWWVITTAGDDPDKASIGWEIHDKATKIANGEYIEPNWYVKIFGVGDKYEGDIYDEKLWYKSNPSLDVTIPIETVRKEAISARNNQGAEKLFRWLRLNQWISTKSTSWIDLSFWDSSVGEWDLKELIGNECYVGLDLGSTTDLTGLVLLFPPQDEQRDWRFISEGWIPEDSLHERVNRDHVPYDKWLNDRYLYSTSGNATDYDFIEARILSLARQYDIRYVCTDNWNSRMLTQRLAKEGIETIEVAQTMAGMTPGMKQIERLMRRNELTHENNPVARWCFGNVNIAIDGNENTKPMKNKSKERIDLTVALINAMSVATRFEKEEYVYEQRGMRSLMD